MEALTAFAEFVMKFGAVAGLVILGAVVYFLYKDRKDCADASAKVQSAAADAVVEASRRHLADVKEIVTNYERAINAVNGNLQSVLAVMEKRNVMHEKQTEGISKGVNIMERMERDNPMWIGRFDKIEDKIEAGVGKLWEGLIVLQKNGDA